MTAPVIDPDVETLLSPPGADDEQECLECECRPHMTFCGRYTPGVPVLDADWGWNDPNICRECIKVARGAGSACPWCGSKP